jgi:hypothetical protein
MAAETSDILREDLAERARTIVGEFCSAVESGEPWYPALLVAIARWPMPLERVGGRWFRYLIGGEAFDWLLLAERLLQEVEDVVPEEEREALLFRGRPPVEQSSEAFRAAVGESKYRAHLNYVYGVVVEEALQLAVEEDVHKELRCGAWGQDRRVDESVYQRIYGRPRDELLAAFRSERGLENVNEILQSELHEFTYWLFRYRIRQCDGARVASDTRRGLVQLSLMQARLHARIPEAEEPEPSFVIEGRAAARA